jgi:hypothetical protein
LTVDSDKPLLEISCNKILCCYKQATDQAKKRAVDQRSDYETFQNLVRCIVPSYFACSGSYQIFDAGVERVQVAAAHLKPVTRASSVGMRIPCPDVFRKSYSFRHLLVEVFCIL